MRVNQTDTETFAYCFWKHKVSGDIYAVFFYVGFLDGDFIDGAISGACGPLTEGDAITDDLLDYDYQGGDNVLWLEEHADEFVEYAGDDR